MKSYTKSVPIYVQVLQRASLRMIAPFLDPERDVLVSVEQMRHRLLALSCLCPGASTLIGAMPASSINACAFKVFDAVLPRHLAGVPFCDAVEWLYRTSGFVLIGARLRRSSQLLPSVKGHIPVICLCSTWQDVLAHQLRELWRRVH